MGLLRAIETIPTSEHWLLGIVLLTVYASIAMGLGFKSNFLKFQLLKSPLKINQIVIFSFFAPALIEEIVFRVLLLPQPTQNLQQLSPVTVIVNLLIFVLYHPLNSLTFFPSGRKTFFDPTFLSLATLLGTICIIAYWLSSSLWLPVVLHWIVVITWLIVLGGYNLLSRTDLALLAKKKP